MLHGRKAPNLSCVEEVENYSPTVHQFRVHVSFSLLETSQDTDSEWKHYLLEIELNLTDMVLMFIDLQYLETELGHSWLVMNFLLNKFKIAKIKKLTDFFL